MSNIRKNKINGLVLQLLSRARISTPAVDVEKVASICKIEIKKRSYDQKGNLSGVLIRHQDKTIMGVNSKDHMHRQRFTIAHEIGHYLLHEGENMFIDKIYRVNFRDSRSSSGEDKREIEANSFAANLLIPAEFLLKDLNRKEVDILNPADIQRLANRYNVSPQAMSLRLAEITTL